MRHDTAPCRLSIWLAAAALGWAVIAGVVLFLPQALAAFALAGVVLWRRGRRPVDLLEAAAVHAAPMTPAVTSAPARVLTRDDLRLVARSA